MEYILKEEVDIQAVVIKVTGMINTKVAYAMVLAAGLALTTTEYHRCFFDLASTEVDPNQTMTEMFMFVDAFKRAGIKKSVKLAALYVSGGDHRLHLEKAANAEGFKLKHFTDRDEALKWLCQ
jgi:hypothetical protein